MSAAAHVFADSPSYYNIGLDMVVRHALVRATDGLDGSLRSQTIQSLSDPSTLLEQDWHQLYTGEAGGNTRWILATHGNSLLGITAERTSARLTIWSYADTEAEADANLAWVVDHAEKVELPAEGLVPVYFWVGTERGPAKHRRVLGASPWDEVQQNYASGVRDQLNTIMEWKDSPPTGGRLLLLHGPPGTGKTHAIRAIAANWLEWCSVHYVVDPERFFGDGNYMLNVLLDGASNEFDEGGNADEWRLIVVEDADELIRKDAKTATGQAMSRLLNVCDGLVGQGLNVLVLITTNEAVGQLHPAITRPGRCLADLHVPLLNARDAKLWLLEHDGDPTALGYGEEFSLATLYSYLAPAPPIRAAENDGPHGVYV